MTNYCMGRVNPLFQFLLKSVILFYVSIREINAAISKI